MSDSKNYIDKLAWIYIKDRKVLSTRSHGKDTYYIPGGKREVGESDKQALVREIREELSVDLRPETIEQYGVFEAQAHGKEDGVVVRMTCYMAEYEGELMSAAEVAEYVWFGHSGREQSSPVDKLIIDDLVKRNLID